MNKPLPRTVLSLDLFNQRAKKLADSRFLSWLKKSGNKQPDMNRLLAGDWLAYNDLNPEDLDSFCLNLRNLIQDRDGYSIRCLSNIYQAFPDDYQEAKNLFTAITQELHDFLERRSLVQLKGKSPMTHKDLLEVILYGGIAHNNEKHYANFVRLTRAGVFSSFVFATFWNIILTLNSTIQRIALLNREVVKWELESKSSPESGSPV